MSKLVLYHGGCMDGFTAAWVAWTWLGDGAEYVSLFYGEGSELIGLPDVRGREVLMLDICAKREELERMSEEAKSFLVIDHHKSHQAACEGLDFCIFDMERSGATLAWDYFTALDRSKGETIKLSTLVERMAEVDPLSRPDLVNYVEDRDLWRMELPYSKEINAYYATVEKTFPNWTKLAAGNREEAVAKGEGALAWLNHYVREVGKEARKVVWLYDGVPYTIYIINVPYLGTSELVGSLASRDVDFAVGWFERKDGTYQYGLRSRDGEVDVSKIAKKYGGGGHANSAGFVHSSAAVFEPSAPV